VARVVVLLLFPKCQLGNRTLFVERCGNVHANRIPGPFLQSSRRRGRSDEDAFRDRRQQREQRKEDHHNAQRRRRHRADAVNFLKCFFKGCTFGSYLYPEP
jgi:hypothetical protein